MNQLYFGDNLHVLRDHLATESVDLIYLDPPAWPKPLRRGEGPPFNSKRDYNLLFKSPVASALRADGSRATGSTLHSQAQITAFEDSWHWGEQAEREFDEIIPDKNTDVSEMIQALRRFLGGTIYGKE